jgi:NAD(P)-dependent dehydrogenase (short-subunit alcohol dehydrogenase family)
MSAVAPAYNVSKAALNAVTRMLAAELCPMTDRPAGSFATGSLRVTAGDPTAPRGVVHPDCAGVESSS